MPFMNTDHRYGAATKAMHWTVFTLVLLQYLSAKVMTHLGPGGSQNFLYDWHKSLGLVILGLMIVRYVWRSTTPLPQWSPVLSEPERRLSHRLEMLLYLLLIALPASGYLFVMTGDFGVRLFGVWALPNPFGKHPVLAASALAAHVLLAYAALVVIAWHVGHCLKKHFYERRRFIHRMLPLSRPAPANRATRRQAARPW